VTNAVLDTNIFVSSVFWEKGNPHKIVEKAIEGEFDVFISEEIIEELEEILRRDFNESDDFIKEQVRLIKEYAEVVEIKERVVIVKEDFKDNKIIECAISASADFIISGDNHLLKIKNYNNIKILNSSDFLKVLSNTNEIL